MFASPTRQDHIGRILVPVMINGRGPFRLVLDTGASDSTVSPELAAVLGLLPSAEPAIVVNGITGSAQLPSVSIDRLQAGDLRAEHLRLPVVWAPLMAGADGILGAAGWVDERVVVDFRHNRVVVSRTHGRNAVSDFQRVRAKRLPGGLLMVRGQVGHVDVQAIIDTGSERTLGNPALAAALHARSRPGAAYMTTTVYGATSDVAAGRLEIAPPISLGPIRIAQAPVVYGDFHIFDVWNLKDQPAVILGMDVLGTVRALAIDFGRAELYLQAIEQKGTAVRSGPSSLGGRFSR